MICAQEQKNPTAGLSANPGLLLRGRCPGEKQLGLARTGRRDHDPTLGLLWDNCVFDEPEAEGSNKESDSFVVVANNEGDEAERLTHWGCG